MQSMDGLHAGRTTRRQPAWPPAARHCPRRAGVAGAAHVGRPLCFGRAPACKPVPQLAHGRPRRQTVVARCAASGQPGACSTSGPPGASLAGPRCLPWSNSRPPDERRGLAIVWPSTTRSRRLTIKRFLETLPFSAAHPPRSGRRHRGRLDTARLPHHRADRSQRHAASDTVVGELDWTGDIGAGVGRAALLNSRINRREITSNRASPGIPLPRSSAMNPTSGFL